MTVQLAKKQIMDHMARRNHSELELREKLESVFAAEIVNKALAWAKQQNWFTSPESLTAHVVDQLQRRGKGIAAINRTLEAKGLQPVISSAADELAKARKVVFAKWSADDFDDLDIKQAQKLSTKIMRLLISRGFDEDVIQDILKKDFKAGALAHDEQF